MIIYPAIDLKDGQCVRLRQGDMDDATVFNEDPADQARRFVDAGARWLHVVDLNGAFADGSVNGAAVQAILDAVAVPVQLGGGIRSLADVNSWLTRGVSRVVLGTAAVKDPEMVTKACEMHPHRIALGIDARAGKVAVEGWAEETDLTAADLVARFAQAGVTAIVYTDIERDGVMGGPNVKATAALAASTEIPVIASGGVSSMMDLEALASRPGIAGAIVGRALYDGRIPLAEALVQYGAI